MVFIPVRVKYSGRQGVKCLMTSILGQKFNLEFLNCRHCMTLSLSPKVPVKVYVLPSNLECL